jgi:hypothetical protein
MHVCVCNYVCVCIYAICTDAGWLVVCACRTLQVGEGEVGVGGERDMAWAGTREVMSVTG